MRNKFNPSAMRKSVYRNTSLMTALAIGLSRFGIALTSPVGDILGTTANPTKKERQEEHYPNGGRNRHPRQYRKHINRTKSAKRNRSKIRMRSHA